MKRIAVIDDDGCLAVAIKMMIRRAGFDSVAIGTPQEALTHLQRPDCVVLRSASPGRAALAMAQLRRRWEGVPGVVIMGCRSQPLEAYLPIERLPSTLVLPVPVNENQLIASLKHLCLEAEWPSSPIRRQDGGLVVSPLVV